MTIIRNGVEIELTAEEARQAYEEYKGYVKNLVGYEYSVNKI